VNNLVAMQVALQRYGPLAVAFAVVNSFFNYKYISVYSLHHL
jgi:hypothetical protein